MSRTKDAIMEIIEWYGYIPKNYTFNDYHIEKQRLKDEKKNIKEFSKSSSKRSNSDQ